MRCRFTMAPEQDLPGTEFIRESGKKSGPSARQSRLDNSEYGSEDKANMVHLPTVNEGRKRVLLIAASILAPGSSPLGMVGPKQTFLLEDEYVHPQVDRYSRFCLDHI